MRQRETEYGAFPELRFDRYIAPMIPDGLPADGQSDAGATEFRAGMQSLEEVEDVVVIFHLEADAVVGDGEHDSEIVAVRAHLDVRMLPLPRLLQRVLEQIA